MSSILSDLSPLEFGVLGCIVGIILSSSLSSADLNSLGNFFELVGQVMLTVQAQMENGTPTHTHAQEFYMLKKEMDDKYNYLLKLLNKRNNL